MNDEFRQYLIDDPAVYSITASKRVFQLISANLEINNTVMYNEGALIDSFVSTVTVSDSQFYDLATTFSAFTITSSTLVASNLTINNISATDNLALFTVTLGSILSMDTIAYHNSLVSFLTCLNSDMNIASLNIYNITSESRAITLSGLTSMRAHNWSISNVESTGDSTIFRIESSQINMMQNVTLNKINQVPFNLRRTNIEIVDKLGIDS